MCTSCFVQDSQTDLKDLCHVRVIGIGGFGHVRQHHLQKPIRFVHNPAACVPAGWSSTDGQSFGPLARRFFQPLHHVLRPDTELAVLPEVRFEAGEEGICFEDSSDCLVQLRSRLDTARLTAECQKTYAGHSQQHNPYSP